MSEAKFTKGPWTADGYKVFAPVFDMPAEFEVANAMYNHQEGLANVNLIAAAPEMYQMLEDISEMNSYELAGFFECSDSIEKLLAKAKGEA